MKQREIKFRAWDTVEKEMREVAMLRYEDGRMTRIAGYWKGTRNNGWTDSDPADGRYVLMQYTGLKDKNGKEIYELMEIDGKYRVLYDAPSYVLQDISKGDIIPIYDEFEITGDYSPLS